jgi:hypothetical protein
MNRYLIWRRLKIPHPHNSRWAGRLGRIDVAVVEHNESEAFGPYQYGVCLPRSVDEFGGLSANSSTWGRSSKTLKAAKRSAERVVNAWLKRACLRHE